MYNILRWACCQKFHSYLLYNNLARVNEKFKGYGKLWTGIGPLNHASTPQPIGYGICDESGAHAGRNGGAVVIARRGARRVHSIVPNQREWLSVLVCINAAGSSIPSFYIFRGKRFRQNCIEKCEAGTTMAMQQRAWMTSYLFSAWMSHFIASVRGRGGISPENRHLLILDGHNNHVTLDVVKEANAAGLDLLTLPAHTSHALQPLDVAVFKPFKQHFREYIDFWSSRHLNEAAASKDTLAQWVSLALRKALSPSNIKKGFSATCIFPLDFNALNEHFLPSHAFKDPHKDSQGGEDSNQPRHREGHGEDVRTDGPHDGHMRDSSATAGDDGRSQRGDEGEEERTIPAIDKVEIEAKFAMVPDSNVEHFFVDAYPSLPEASSEVVGLEAEAAAVGSITQFLTLATVATRVSRRSKDPIMDFSKSIMLTSDQYINATTQLKEARAESARQKEQARLEKEEKKKKRLSVRKSVGQKKPALPRLRRHERRSWPNEKKRGRSGNLERRRLLTRGLPGLLNARKLQQKHELGRRPREHIEQLMSSQGQWRGHRGDKTQGGYFAGNQRSHSTKEAKVSTAPGPCNRRIFDHRIWLRLLPLFEDLSPMYHLRRT
jgi:hypothetical protein